MTATVGSDDQLSSAWLGLQTSGFAGGVASIFTGPRCTGALQLPALSTVRRWNHHSPSARAGLVVPDTDSSTVFAAPGSVVASYDQA